MSKHLKVYINITIGVLLIVVGVGFGIISIINGGKLIRAKKEVLF